MGPSFCCGRRITRRGVAYSLKPFQHGVSHAFSVFPDLRPVTAALQCPRGERWRHMRVSSGLELGMLTAWIRPACLFSTCLLDTCTAKPALVDVSTSRRADQTVQAGSSSFRGISSTAASTAGPSGSSTPVMILRGCAIITTPRDICRRAASPPWRRGCQGTMDLLHGHPFPALPHSIFHCQYILFLICVLPSCLSLAG